MQRNSTASKIIFHYTIANLDCDNERFYWTKISTKQLIQSILQNYLTNEITVTRNIQVFIIRLMFENTNLHDMICSEDNDISQVAIQMLFSNYLDLYNKLDTTGYYEYTLHEYPKLLTFYPDKWYKRYCYE